jgi:uncharacterized protein YdeI (YjbR/CyaY-like superfamily)
MKKKIHLVEEFYTFGCGRCERGGTPECKVHTWEKELEELRKLALDCGLEETLKWSFPCFTHEGKNIVLLAAFSDYCSLSFFNGSLLQDPEGILVLPGENSRIARLAKFTSLRQIREFRKTLSAYIQEAMELSRQGKKPSGSKEQKLELPQELVSAFAADASLKKAFLSLTPGRQRGYVIHFTQAKQPKTRLSRIEKCASKIKKGLGFHDR